MVSKSTREQARRYLVHRGAAYYRKSMLRCGVESFSDLSGAELKRLAAAAIAVKASKGRLFSRYTFA